MTKRNNNIKILKRIVAITLGLAFLAFLGAFLYWAWEGDTRPMVSVADKFKPLDGWVLERESIVPPKNICLSDVPCPSMWRTYTLKSRISQEDFVKFAKQGGFEDSEIGECKLDVSPYRHGLVPYCSTKTKIINQYKVYLTSTVHTDDESQCTVGIDVEGI